MQQVSQRQIGDYYPQNERMSTTFEQSLMYSDRHKTSGREAANMQSFSALNKPLRANHLQVVDDLLEVENDMTGKAVYQRGVNKLRKGLIDVQGVLNVINKDQLTDDSSCPNSTIDYNCNEKDQWKQAMDVMKRNPDLLLDCVPSVWDEDPNAPQNKTTIGGQEVALRALMGRAAKHNKDFWKRGEYKNIPNKLKQPRGRSNDRF